MSVKYSIGFLVASVVQAAIIMLSEKFKISFLGANITPIQLLIHILAGQVAGYVLLYIMGKSQAIKINNIWAPGIVYGAIVWVILLSINSMIGKVHAPWTQGSSTVIASLFAFIIYGIIASYTIKEVDVRVVDK